MIEPEEWITKAEVRDKKSSPVFQKRSRVPQSTTFHGYQAFISLALRRLFQTYDLELAKAGARCASWFFQLSTPFTLTWWSYSFIPQDPKLHWSGVPLTVPRHKYTSTTFPVAPNITRAGFEAILRRLVLAACPNVRYIAGTVTGLVKSGSSGKLVHSVRIRSCDGGTNTLPATLVIGRNSLHLFSWSQMNLMSSDCTGPAIGGFRWLQSLTSASSTSTQRHCNSLPLDSLKITYDPKMAYSTCTFNVPITLISSLNAIGLPENFETGSYLFVNFSDPSLDRRNVIVALKENNARAPPNHFHSFEVQVADLKHLVQFVCGGWDVREQMTSVEDIKNFLSRIKVARPLPKWIYRVLILLDEERVQATYVHARCRTLVSNTITLTKLKSMLHSAVGICAIPSCWEHALQFHRCWWFRPATESRPRVIIPSLFYILSVSHYSPFQARHH